MTMVHLRNGIMATAAIIRFSTHTHTHTDKKH